MGGILSQQLTSDHVYKEVEDFCREASTAPEPCAHCSSAAELARARALLLRVQQHVSELKEKHPMKLREAEHHVLEDGTEIFIDEFGKRCQKNPDGSEVTTLHSGEKISKYPDGIVIESRTDGTKLQTNADGSTILTRVDGSTEQYNQAKGIRLVKRTDGTVLQTNETKGTSIQLFADGTKIDIDAKGFRVVKFPDGRKLQRNPDGTTIETFTDGHKIQVMPDGTTIECFPDGRKVQEYANGEKVEQFPDGKTVVTKGAFGSIKCGRCLTFNSAGMKKIALCCRVCSSILCASPQLSKGLPTEEAVFQMLDTQHGGSIGFSQLKFLLLELNLPLNAEDTAKIVKVEDESVITLEQFKDIFKRLQDHILETVKNSTFEMTKELLIEQKRRLEEEQKKAEEKYLELEQKLKEAGANGAAADEAQSAKALLDKVKADYEQKQVQLEDAKALARRRQRNAIEKRKRQKAQAQKQLSGDSN